MGLDRVTSVDWRRVYFREKRDGRFGCGKGKTFPSGSGGTRIRGDFVLSNGLVFDESHFSQGARTL